MMGSERSNLISEENDTSFREKLLTLNIYNLYRERTHVVKMSNLR